MSKKDYESAEKAFDEARERQKQEELWEESGKPPQPYEDEERRSMSTTDATELLESIQQELKLVQEMEAALDLPVTETNEGVQRLLQGPGDIPTEEWERLKKVRQDIVKVRKQMGSMLSPEMERAVRAKRREQWYSRIGIKKGWIPL